MFDATFYSADCLETVDQYLNDIEDFVAFSRVWKGLPFLMEEHEDHIWIHKGSIRRNPD